MIREAGRIAWASEVNEALTTLEPDEQAFIRLSYFGGIDQAGIAENTGVSLAAVSRTIASGMQRLGRVLELRPAPRSSPTKSPTKFVPPGPELGLGA